MRIDQKALETFFAGGPAGQSLSSVDLSRVPRHIAVIMDGNGRWARQRGLSRGHGHAAGVESLHDCIAACVRLGVDVLTAYVFSTENWNRPQEEVDLLMALFASTVIDKLPLLMGENVRLVCLGDVAALPQETSEMFARALRETSGNDGMVLALAVNYGSRAEIVRACRTLASRCVAGELSPDDIDGDLFADALYTAGLPDPELVIRTSGEKRLSNYLLWQCAYSEFVFADALWPDFDRWHLLDAIAQYQRRDRRFGGVGDGKA